MVGPEGRGTAQQAISAVEARRLLSTSLLPIGVMKLLSMTGSTAWDGGGCKGEPADDGWGRGRRPVIHVSYNDISQQYLPWLSESDRLRLPVADRGGVGIGFAGRQQVEPGRDHRGRGAMCSLPALTETPPMWRPKCGKPSGPVLPAMTVFLYTAPVGSLKPQLAWHLRHAWQCLGMGFRLLGAPPYDTEEPGDPANCKYHVLRGGSWASEFRFLPDGVWIGDAVAYRAAVRGWETSVKARNFHRVPRGQIAAVSS